ncbi:MAG: Re/Si-specific NAD(P)(+) transhydrogenase subunit alpha [Candidatus Paracaedibacteraceae bacterium]|nr:Re/Si-specific NAD(P)(+) transhydrogenase subunit alpha [Candidatus Paracaedibacteraceae bacterium]
MKIAIAKERRPFENRVAATPETVKKFVSMGAEVFVERGAGESVNISDKEYEVAGAKITKDAAATFESADLILKVQRPFLPKEGKDNEIQHMKKGAIVCAHMNVLNSPEQVKVYRDHGITAVALELIPRITRAQSMDILSSQSNLAGYRAVIEAASVYDRGFAMMMTAAGTVAPAKVLVLGAGVAGLQAIASARRMGAVVSAFDVRAAAKEQVESLGAKFIEVDSEEKGDTSSGYAKEMSTDYQKRQSAKIAETLEKSDIVITTALIPGKPAPKLITADMLKRMKPGSVIVDMAVENGGNCEGSVPGEVAEVSGVKIIGHLNLPARIAKDASGLFAKNVFNFVSLIVKDKAISLNFEDEIIHNSVLTHDGKITSPLFKDE